MLEYFDLNKRALKGKEQFMQAELHGVSQEEDSLGLIIQKKAPAAKREGSEQLSVPRQILMYAGVFIGVLFSSLVDQFKQAGNATVSFTIGQIIVSSIIALMIIPKVYEKLTLDPRAPFIVQFGIFVQNGIFWQVAIKAIAVAVNIK